MVLYINQLLGCYDDQLKLMQRDIIGLPGNIIKAKIRPKSATSSQFKNVVKIKGTVYKSYSAFK